MRSIPAVLVLVPSLVVAFACGGKVEVPDTTVRGTTQGLTLPSVPVAVVARAESGRAITSPVTNGAFSLSLPKGHSYALSVVTAKGEAPLVFPRTSGRLDATFVVRSRGAKVDLGALRFASGAPASGFQFRQSAAAPAQSDCTDCVDDQHDVECDDGSQGADNASNVTATQASSTLEMALAEHNAPESVDGCGGDEQDGDNNDGQH